MDTFVFFITILAIVADKVWLLALPIVLFAIKRHWVILFWLSAGVLIALGHYLKYPNKLIEPNPYQVVRVEGRVLERISTNGQEHLVFLLHAVDHKMVHARAWLSCYRSCQSFKTGQHYRFQAVLQKPHTLRNLGSLHRGHFLQKMHIDVLVKPRSKPIPLRAIGAETTSWRSRVQKHIALHLKSLSLDSTTQAITEALVIGDSHLINKHLWEVFRLTGTTHLMVISGAHIGLLASMLYAFGFWAWRLSAQCCLLLTAPQFASLLSMLGSIAYVCLSGFEPPAERALLAVLFVLSRFWIGRRFSMLSAWRYAIIAVLFIEPHAVLFPGFYLSFLAALLLILSRFMVKRGYLVTLFMVQGLCLVGLTPLTLYFFGFGGLNGLATNFFAIPWVGYGVLPLAILTVCLPQNLAYYSGILLQKMVLGLLATLEYFAQYPIALPLGEVGLSWVMTAYLMLVLIFFWRKFAVQSLMIVLLIILCFPFDTTSIQQGEVRVDVLDVGQGLSVGVHTKSHHLLFDTGGAWYGGDMGSMVVLPYLLAEGVRYLDKVVISHGDLDHRGGFESIKQRLPIGQVLSNGLGRYQAAANCRKSRPWEWDGVSFRFLNPHKVFKDSNNRSCVLQITANGRNILLTGDIETKAEKALLMRYKNTLKADVLLLAHHASKTSTSEAFLKAVAPQYAVASYAYANPYRFPHEPVVKRLQQHKIPLFTTAEMGMIRVQSQAGTWTIQRYG